MNPAVSYEMEYYIFEQEIIFTLSRVENVSISLCFRLIVTSDLRAASSFSSSLQSLQLVMNQKVNYGLVKY